MQHKERLSIAIIDDEQACMEIWEHHLVEAGHNVTTFDSSDSFLCYYKKHCKDLDLIITDWKMPCNGQRLVRTVVEINPSQAFLVVSSSADKRFDGLLVFVSKVTLANTEDKAELLVDKYRQVKENHTRAILQLGLMDAKVKSM